MNIPPRITHLLGPDLHPDADIIVAKTPDDAKLNMSIGQGALLSINDKYWIGEYCDFSCQGATLVDLIEFIYFQRDSKTPKLEGKDLLPNDKYYFSFKNTKWKSYDEVRGSILDAIKVVFKVDLIVSKVNGETTIVIVSLSNNI